MLVQIGSDNVDCDTYLDVFFDLSAPSGYFVYFAVPKLPGTYDQQSITIEFNTSRDFNGYQSFGSAVIDTVDPERVTGSVTFAADDEEIGAIAVSGTFDVVRCF